MITLKELQTLREIVEKRLRAVAVEEEFIRLERKFDVIPITSEPEEEWWHVEHSGTTASILKCCKAMHHHYREKTIKIIDSGVDMSLAIVTKTEGFARVVYCPWCGIKTHVK